MSNYFKCKQFTVNQDRCAMKVGTDGMLLGSWVSLENNPQTVFDIGAGTGLIALMLAQRSTAEQIDAIEIDEDAYEQCVENFENSPWANRLFCYHASLNEFAEEMEDQKYDLIVSNPPYYPSPAPTKGVSNTSEARKKARFYDLLPFEDLVRYAAQLLSASGELAIVIPFADEERVIACAKAKELFPFRITRVRGTANAPVKRSLIQFSFTSKKTENSHLVLEVKRHEYTPEFKKLLTDFYLKL